MTRFAVLAALVIGAVIAVSMAVQTWRGDMPRLSLSDYGAIHSVLLTNNQVYYGRLELNNRYSIKLSHVFYVQVVVDDKTGAHTNKLIERSSNDWHAPTSMTIPIDKIMFVEVVGLGSQVAKLIAEAEGRR